jgi:hypothetical protein
MKPPIKKAATSRRKKAAAKANNETSLAILSQREADYYQAMSWLAPRLAVIEAAAFKRACESDRTEDAAVYLTASHQLRMVIRDLKLSGSKLDEAEGAR